MTKTFLACALTIMATGCVHAQTNLSTPVKVLPKADLSNAGQILICDKVDASCSSSAQIDIQGNNAFRIQGRVSSNGNILLHPGNVPGLSSVFVNPARTDTPDLILADGGVNSTNGIALQTNTGVNYFSLDGSISQSPTFRALNGTNFHFEESARFESTAVTAGLVFLGAGTDQPEVKIANSVSNVDITPGTIQGSHFSAVEYSLDTASGGRLQINTAGAVLVDNVDVNGMTVASSAVTSGLISIFGGSNNPEITVADNRNLLDIATNGIAQAHFGSPTFSIVGGVGIGAGVLATFTNGVFTTIVGQPSLNLAMQIVDVSATDRTSNYSGGTVYSTNTSNTNLWWALASASGNGLLRLANGSGGGGIDGLGSTTLINGTRAEFPALRVDNMTSGGTQCVQVDTLGTFSGIGSPCGSGGFNTSAWTSYSPSISNLTGTTTVAAYNQNGKTTFVRIAVSGTSNGSNPVFGLPFTPVTSNQTFACTIVQGGAAVAAAAQVSGGAVIPNIYNNTALSNGVFYTFTCQGVYETT